LISYFRFPVDSFFSFRQEYKKVSFLPFYYKRLKKHIKNACEFCFIKKPISLKNKELLTIPNIRKPQVLLFLWCRKV